MSYCVNCGVELADSERRCPLCGTEVVNPAKPAVRVYDYPYPRQVEALTRRIDKRFLVSIVGTLLLLPVLICAVCDLLTGGGISWSLYVAGGAVLLFTVVFVPMLFKKRRVWLNLTLDLLVTAAYVGGICLVSGGSWFWTLGLPLVAASGSLAVFLAVLFGLGSARELLVRVAFVLFGSGLLAVVIDLLIKLYLGQPPVPGWSLFVLAPCALLGVAALLLRRKNNFKEEIRRRFYV